MDYKKRFNEDNILHESVYKDYKVIIVKVQVWECAYVIFPEKRKYLLLDYDFEIDNNDLISVHGGITFQQQDYGIGWDYAHVGDLEKEWKISHIVDEARFVIDQLEEIATKGVKKNENLY